MNDKNKVLGNTTIYGSEFLNAEIEKCIPRVIEDISNLRMTIYPNATVLPYKSCMENGLYTRPYYGGVVDNQGELIYDSFLLWKQFTNDEKFGVAVGKIDEMINLSDVEYIDEDVVYLGDIPTQFGHFLYDSLQRLYFLLYDDHKDKIAVYVPQQINYASHFIKLYHLAGIAKDKLMSIVKPIRFRSVLVCQPSINYTCRFHKRFKDVCDLIRGNVPELPYEKIYFSRSKLRGNGVTYGEELFERIFEQNGYTIFYPETLSLTKQIRLMKNCKKLAGVSGSAMHLAMFAQDGLECAYFTRTSHPAYSQLTIDAMRKIKASYIETNASPFLLPICDSPYLIDITLHMEEFLKNSKFVYKHEKQSHQTMINFLSHFLRHKLAEKRDNYAIKPCKLYFEDIYKVLHSLFNYIGIESKVCMITLLKNNETVHTKNNLTESELLLYNDMIDIIYFIFHSRDDLKNKECLREIQLLLYKFIEKWENAVPTRELPK